MVELEKKLCGVERGKDFRYFIENKLEIWKTILCRDADGELLGFLGSVDHPASQMIGPGIAKNEKVTIQMLACMLDLFREKSPVFLLPVTAKETENIHGVPEIVKYTFRSATEITVHPRVIMPTFMPET